MKFDDEKFLIDCINDALIYYEIDDIEKQAMFVLVKKLIDDFVPQNKLIFPSFNNNNMHKISDKEKKCNLIASHAMGMYDETLTSFNEFIDL